MTEYVSLKGPVEKIDDSLFIRIPLEAGGHELADCTNGISEKKEGKLWIEIKEWMAEKLELSEGTVVHVDNQNGEFSIQKIDK